MSGWRVKYHSCRCFVYIMLHVLVPCRQNMQIIDLFSFSSRCPGITHTYLVSSSLFIDTGREPKCKGRLQMAQKLCWALDHKGVFPCIDINPFMNIYGVHLAFLYFTCTKQYVKQGGWIFAVSKLLVTDSIEWRGTNGVSLVWWNRSSDVMSVRHTGEYLQ